MQYADIDDIDFEDEIQLDQPIYEERQLLESTGVEDASGDGEVEQEGLQQEGWSSLLPTRTSIISAAK